MKKPLLFGLVTILFGLSCGTAGAQVAKFESLYIFNICRYVEWPAGIEGSGFKIGVIGANDDLVKELETVAASKTIQNKKMVISPIGNAGDTKSCYVLFFTDGAENRIAEFASTAKNALIITEADGATQKGSAINFFLDDGKLKFEIKKANAEKAGLKVSNDLLNLAAKSL